MTWYELIYWCSFPVIFATLSVYCLRDKIDVEDVIMGSLCIWIFMLLGGGIVAVSTTPNKPTDWNITKKFETIPKVVNLDNTGLDIITDENTHVRFTDYKDIAAWKDGGKFYKVYYHYKNNFGPDSEKSEVGIEKVEK